MRWLTMTLPVLSILCAGAAKEKERAMNLPLNLRTRVEAFKGSGTWEEVTLRREISPPQMAIVICDMWERHW